MKPLQFLRNTTRPLVAAALVAASLVSYGQVLINNGQTIGQRTQPAPPVQQNQRQFSGKVTEIQREAGTLELRSQAKSEGHRVSPSKFFPMVSDGPSTRSVKPENPSRRIPPRFFELANRGSLAPTPFGNGTTTTSASGKAKFPGIGFTGSLPPDTSIGVGPEYVVEVVNTSIAFFRKSNGQRVFQTTMDSNGFFAGTGIGPTPFAFDPRVVYDKEAGRFYAIILDVNFDVENPGSSVILAVSTTSNPLDDWHVYRMDNLFRNPDEDFEAYWGDYPQIGFNKDFIVVSTNMFPIDAGELPSWTNFQVINKESAFTGVQAVQFFFDDFQSFTARPTRQNGNADAPAYAVTYRGWGGGNVGIYRIYAFESVLFFPQASFVDSTVVGGDTPFGGSSGSPVPGMFVDNIPFRSMDASFADGRMATAMTGFDQAGKAAIIWVEWTMNNFPVNGNLPTIRQANFRSESGDFHAFQPAIEINATGNSSLIYTRSSGDVTPQVVVAVRKKDDPLGTFGPSQVLATSNDYSGLGLPFAGRWGDYAGIAVDPNDDSVFWGCNEIGLDTLQGFETLWDTVIVTWDIPSGNTQLGVAPLSVTPIYGTNSGGNVGSFAAVDDDMYDLTAQAIVGRGNYAAYELVFQSPDTKANTSRIDFSVEVQVTGEAAPGYLYLYNVTTGRWDLLRTVRIGTTLTTAGLRVNTGGQNYTADNGQIKARVLAFQPVKRRGAIPIPFEFRTDQGILSINNPN